MIPINYEPSNWWFPLTAWGSFPQALTRIGWPKMAPTRALREIIFQVSHTCHVGGRAIKFERNTSCVSDFPGRVHSPEASERT